MNKWYSPQRAIPILIALSFITMVLFIGSTPLFDPDEPVYGETAKEMLLYNNWLSPRIYGQFWYDKPPMFYWLSAISYTLFGISEFTSRLPSALLGMATVLLVYMQGRKFLSDRAAFFSALITTTSLGIFYIAKAAVTDMALIFSLSAALLFLYNKRYYWAYAFCGIALLVKGPIGYAFPFLIFLFYLIGTRKWYLLKEMKLCSGIALAFLVGLPWYIAMYHFHGDDFLQTFIGFHNVTRFTEPEHPGQNSYIRYIPILLLAMFPWTGTLLASLARSFTRKKESLLYLHIWAWFIFLFFSFSKTQLITYIAPMFIPIALILGHELDALAEMKGATISRIGGILHLLLGIAGIGSAFLYLPSQDLLASLTWPTIAVLLLLTVPGAYFLLRSKIEQAVLSITFGGAVLSLFLTTQLAPQLSPVYSAYEIAKEVRLHYDGSSPLYVDKFVRPTLAFYTDIYGTEWPRPFLDHLDTIEGPVYYVMRKEGYNKISYDVMCQQNPTFAKYKILADTGYYILLVSP